MKEYTTAEVKKHNDESSTWIIVHNDIYDITAYLDQHPGGMEVLIEEAGKDATEAFEDVGHSSDAVEVMAQYKIGTLVASERKEELPDDPDLRWKLADKPHRHRSLPFWIVPTVLGVVSSVFYRFCFM